MLNLANIEAHAVNRLRTHRLAAFARYQRGKRIAAIAYHAGRVASAILTGLCLTGAFAFIAVFVGAFH